MAIFIAALAGCETTNFAKSATPVTVTEEWSRSSATTWGGTRIYSIGNIEFDYLQYGNGATFTVDPGPTTIRAWYYANRGNTNNFFYQTKPVEMKAVLKPNGKYQVTGDYQEKSVRFSIVDLDTKEVVARSEEEPIVLKRYPGPPPPIIIPVFTTR